MDFPEGLTETLKDLGLTETETTIYLSGLARGPLTVQELGTETGIKRPTIYHALGTLGAKGLCAEQKKDGKNRFRMAEPEHLLEWVRAERVRLEKREDEVLTLLPQLALLTSSGKKDDFSAVEYSGIAGVKAAYDMALYSKSKRWDVIAPVHNFLREYDETFALYYLNARRRHGITARTLWEHWPEGRKLTPAEIKEREPRFMPKEMQGKFTSMLVLFDDKVLIVSPLEDAFAVVITSKQVHTLLSALFEGIWTTSEPYV